MKDRVTVDPERVEALSNLPETRTCSFSETVIYSAGSVGVLRHLAQGICSVSTKMESTKAASLTLPNRVPAQIVV